MGDRAERETRLETTRSGTPQPLGGLADVAELLAGDSERSRRFMGGLVAGALLGAAIAGAALVRRRTSDDRRS